MLSSDVWIYVFEIVERRSPARTRMVRGCRSFGLWDTRCTIHVLGSEILPQPGYTTPYLVNQAIENGFDGLYAAVSCVLRDCETVCNNAVTIVIPGAIIGQTSVRNVLSQRWLPQSVIDRADQN